ncbi:hypothetical protein ABEW07_01680 [Bacillus paramycoides]
MYFRDFLRLHKDLAQEYSNLKMSLIKNMNRAEMDIRKQNRVC